MKISKKWRIIAGIVIVLLITGVIYSRLGTDAMTTSHREARVIRGDLQVRILATGVVQPKNRLEIKPPIAGRAESVLVSEGDHVRRGQVLALISSVERAALLDAARGRGREELKKWESYYKPTQVIAPINGMLILRNIEPGQTFTTQDSILVISDQLSVKAKVDETDLAKIKRGQKAVITLDAYPDREIAGTVSHIAFDAVTVNNVTTYEIDVVPDTTPDYMRSGMTANVSFLVASGEDVLLIPAEAVKVEDGKAVVLVPHPQSPRDTLSKDVQLGLSDGNRTEVTSGLREGETILIPQPQTDRDNRQTGTVNPFAPRRGGGRR